MKELVNELGLEDVYFEGFKQGEELIKYYSACDIFVLPSRHDTWAVVVNEAMACALPVVVSWKAGASRDLVEEGKNGFVVPELDPEAIARAVVHIIKNEDMKALGERGRQKVGEWDYSFAVDQFKRAVRRAGQEKEG
jgi:glycosyltransferase involved in cell wall biosynthesis